MRTQPSVKWSPRRYASFLMGISRGFGLIAGIISSTATGFLISQVGQFIEVCQRHLLLQALGHHGGAPALHDHLVRWRQQACVSIRSLYSRGTLKASRLGQASQGKDSVSRPSTNEWALHLWERSMWAENTAQVTALRRKKGRKQFLAMTRVNGTCQGW